MALYELSAELPRLPWFIAPHEFFSQSEQHEPRQCAAAVIGQEQAWSGEGAVEIGMHETSWVHISACNDSADMCVLTGAPVHTDMLHNKGGALTRLRGQCTTCRYGAACRTHQQAGIWGGADV